MSDILIIIRGVLLIILSYRGHGNGLNVGDGGRTTKHAHIGRERRLETRLALFAFQTLYQSLQGSKIEPKYNVVCSHFASDHTCTCIYSMHVHVHCTYIGYTCTFVGSY